VVEAVRNESRTSETKLNAQSVGRSRSAQRREGEKDDATKMLYQSTEWSKGRRPLEEWKRQRKRGRGEGKGACCSGG
jgi:hypothetical protein